MSESGEKLSVKPIASDTLHMIVCATYNTIFEILLYIPRRLSKNSQIVQTAADTHDNFVDMGTHDVVANDIKNGISVPYRSYILGLKESEN